MKLMRQININWTFNVEGVQHSQGFIHPQGNNNPPQGEVGQDNHLV
jgi:hypothetical protein